MHDLLTFWMPAADTEAEKEAYYRDSQWPEQDTDPLAK
jgi:hypothetical protein